MKTIHADQNAHKKDYEYLGPQQLAVTDVFSTIQGEGPFAGERALFIRLAGCNLGGKGLYGPGCPFCDTDFRLSASKTLSFGQLLVDVTNKHPGRMSNGKYLVVITGGEPLLQDNLGPFLEGAACQLPDDEWQWQVETNGSLSSKLPDSAYLVLSPKVPEMAGKTATYGRPAKETWDKAGCLKLLVSADPSSPYNNLPPWLLEWQLSQRPVYLSPIAVYKKEPIVGTTNMWDGEVFDIAKCAMNHNYAAKLCERFGFRLSMQMHLFAGLK